jgi:hypothetical protein
MNAPIEAIPRGEILEVQDQYADQLHSLLRFSRFFTRHETPEDWVTLLGPDVISSEHPVVTALITNDFIDYNAGRGVKLSIDEEIRLRTTPWVHDWGELSVSGIGVGDVNFDKKQRSHEEVEFEVFMHIINQLPEGKSRSLIIDVYTDIAQNHNTRLGRMFNAIERIGYFGTAMRAFQGNLKGERITNWRGLVGNVVSNQMVKLLEYRKDYPYIDHALGRFEPQIDAVFEVVFLDEVPEDANQQPSYSLEKLRQAEHAWSVRNEPILELA